MNNVEIFDVHFINENIYSGFDFSDEHRKQLHQFVIGAQGVAIKQLIESNKSAKSTSRQTIADLKQQIIDLVGNNLNSQILNSFISIPVAHTTNIDGQITLAEQALNNANAQGVISSLPLLNTISQITNSIDFTNLESDLQTTSQTIQSDILKELFEEHCTDLTDNEIEGPEAWLKTGFKYIKSKNDKINAGETESLTCPYCKQEVDNSFDILTSYTQKFNEEFNALSARTGNHLVSVSNFNLDLILQNYKNVKALNAQQITSWTTHLPTTTTAPVFDIVQDEDEIKTIRTAVIDDIQQALQNPSQEVAITNSISLRTKIQEINTKIARYNNEVTVYNSAITAFKSTIPAIALAQAEVEKLKRIKLRHDTAVDTLVNNLAAEKQSLSTLDGSYAQLLQQQETAATAFFTTYSTKINHYLGTVFRTQFKIDNVVNIAPQGRATQSKIGYRLTFDNQAISFQSNQQFSAKECLSEGDKSTIALAFFLAKLEIDPLAADKILVFDDPLSSLDTKRRNYTIAIIKKFVASMKQVIVLSHIEHFLHEIQKEFGQSEKSTLRITENYVAKESIIEYCDIDELVKNDYFKQIEALENFRVSPDHAIKDSVIGWLRNVLESHIRFKFYKALRTMTGYKTFGRLVDFLDSTGVPFKDNGNRQNTIDNLKLINGVSWKSHHGTPQPNYSTLGINPNSISPSELDTLIQDTLDLIENKL